MKIVRGGRKERISKEGFVIDYRLTKKLGLAMQILNGRVPNHGAYINTVCSETCYVISGTATIFINDKPFRVKQKDVIIIDPKETSYIIAKNLKMITVTVPDWYPKQCKTV